MSKPQEKEVVDGGPGMQEDFDLGILSTDDDVSSYLRVKLDKGSMGNVVAASLEASGGGSAVKGSMENVVAASLEASGGQDCMENAGSASLGLAPAVEKGSLGEGAGVEKGSLGEGAGVEEGKEEEDSNGEGAEKEEESKGGSASSGDGSVFEDCMEEEGKDGSNGEGAEKEQQGKGGCAAKVSMDDEKAKDSICVTLLKIAFLLLSCLLVIGFYWLCYYIGGVY